MSVVQRSPKVTLKCPLGNVSTDKVVMNASVNAHTTVTFTAYSGQEASVSSSRVFNSDAAALMGKAQTIGFSRRTSADTTVSLDDGGGNTMDFDGYLVSPTFFLDTRSINPGFAAVAASATIANLRLDIYVTDNARDDTIALTGGIKTVESMSQEANLADRMASLTRNLVEFWNKSIPEADSAAHKIAKERDAINKAGPLDQWYAILENSRSTMNPVWMSVVHDNETGFGAQFNTDIINMLRGKSRDFQEIIDTFCSDYQMMFVPGFGSDPGQFIQMKDVIGTAAQTLVLPANSQLLNGNVSHDLLPVQQVLMQGTPRPALLQTADSENMNLLGGGTLIGGFPADAPSASGDVPIIPMPAYMAGIIDAAGSGTGGDLPPSASGISPNYTRMSEIALRFMNSFSDKFVTDYCKSVYIDMAIGSTSTSISMPADLTLWPGARYSVKSSSGFELFTGFLHGVQHTFSKSQGAGSAMTMCNFTHIMFPGFKLPGIP